MVQKTGVLLHIHKLLNIASLFMSSDPNLIRCKHLDMVSMCRGYRRSTRYKAADNSKPRYLTIHEFDTTEMPWDQLKMTSQTEWSKKVIGGVQTMESNVWELIIERGKTMEKL